MSKILMWVGIGIAVVLVEVGISYFAIIQLGGHKQAAVVAELAVDESAAETSEQPAVQKDLPPTGSSEAMTDAEFDIGGAYTLSDFVVNPAYSQGKHFFVSSMVFIFRDKAMVQAITDKEPILQDRIISQLGKRTFAWFGDINNRATLKLELEEMVKDILNIKGGVKVYFSKYVLQ